MAMEKGLYAAPLGLGDAQGDALEIDIVNPEVVTLSDGSVEITLMPEAETDEASAAPFESNLAEYLDEGVLSTLASDLSGLIDADRNSRKDWADTFVKGLEVLGFKYEDRTDPWQGSCGVFSTVLAEAAIRFQAETMSETVPAAGPVKTKILGEITREKEDAALRVKADMNYELTEVMVEYRPEHERMLYTLGLAGSAFKKIYYDPAMGRQVSVFIPPEDVIVPYGASHIETAERVTHVMRKTKNEVKKLQQSGFYVDVDLGEPTPYHSDIEEKKAEESGYTLTDDDRYTLYEVHADLVIEGLDGGEDEDIAKPYVVTIDRGTNKVLAVRRNWNPADPLMLKRQYFIHYVYVPGFGFYGLGLIHIVGGYARAGTSLIRQLVDAGTLSNLPGGLKTRGLRIKGDDTPIPPGEFRDVDVPSGSIRDNIMPLPYKEPSQTLLALLNQITEEGRRLGAISDMKISDMSANAPVGTTLAILERTLKPMAAVQARVHYAMKQEFKLLRAIIAEYAPLEYTYLPDRGEPRARQADYAMVEVIPVSDPNSSTMAQRVVQYQAVLQMAQGSPQIYDLPQLHRQMIEVLGIKNADKLVPTKDDIKPSDPVSENMAVLVGKPVKAFMYQDHDAHIATHQAFMQDPQIAAFMGQNPASQQIMAALSAHIAEHVAFSYRKQIEMKLGATLAEPGKEMPEESEVLLSQVMSQAAMQLTQQKQQQAAQQAAQQQMQDPVIQMQMQELQLKGAELQRKAQKDAADVALNQEKLDVERQRIAAQTSTEAARLQSQQQQAAQKMQLDVAKELLAAAEKQTQERAAPPQR
jgi:hypothetical protein